MFKVIIQHYISEQLRILYNSEKCCQKFMRCVYEDYWDDFVMLANELKFRWRSCLCTNQEGILVFKQNCIHITEEVLSLSLTPESVKDMYALHTSSEFIDSVSEMHMSPEFLSPGNSTPIVAPHRFSFPLKQSITHINRAAQISYQKDCPIQSYKARILNGLQRNRVLLVNGAPNLDKSAAIPMYIIERSAEDKRSCKIICVEREQLIAIYNSERLAEHFNEKVGGTVGFQVQLQSRISDSSNLIFTTSSFFLRVLMGQPITNSFRHISHVVMVDVHLHEAFADVLLHELREALKYHAHLKVILLSDSHGNQEFLNYFGQGEELSLRESNNNNNMLPKHLPQVLYNENILQLMPEKRLSAGGVKAFRSFPIVKRYMLNKMYMDYCLETYEKTGSEKSFEYILYMIHGEYAAINYRHSVTGRTALILSSLYGKINHVKALLLLNADPCIADQQNVDALGAALSMRHMDCVDLLKGNYFEGSLREHNTNKEYVDHYLIIDIIHMLTTSDKWKNGDIIVFLPCYEHLIRLNYNIIKQKIVGNLPENLMLYLLHNNTEKSELDGLMKNTSRYIKCILATEMAETFSCFKNIRYIIDTGRVRKTIYNSNAMCKEYVYDWVPQQSMESRKLLLDQQEDNYCFRLISSRLYKCLPEYKTPELLTIPLDRVCLTVKLLAPHTLITEYLDDTIVKPTFIQIYRCVEFLKRINVFSEMEDITWLGCRLIDVPVDCHLGKLLVLAILLQCLDPVLTIVSFMSTYDPMELSNYVDDLVKPFQDNVRVKIKEERLRLAESHLSDHFMYLRLYQEWQNMLRDGNSDFLLNEYHFMLDGLVEHVCDIRTQLVGALRSSQLIHNKGTMSMHYINMKSNCWPLIKAVLAGGLYPNICYADYKVNRLKSARKNELVLHPNSVLRGCELDSMVNAMKKFNSPWIIYSKALNSWSCNSINFNTVVAPIGIALFAGPPKISSSNIKYLNPAEQKAIFSIDEWLSYTMDHNEAQLILKTRQYFYSTYMNYLQNCNSIEKCRHINFPMSQNAHLFDCLEKILVQEDAACGFKQPDKCGLRPKAMPNKVVMGFNIATTTVTACLNSNDERATGSKMEMMINCPKKSVMPEKQFFMAYQKITDHKEYNNNNNNNNNKNVTHEPNYEWCHLLGKVMMDNKMVRNTKLTYVITYTRNPDKLRSVSIVDWCGNGQVKLRDCFRSDINLIDIMSVIRKYDTLVLSLKQQRNLFPISNEVGELILNLFAFRNNWLHTY